MRKARRSAKHMKFPFARVRVRMEHARRSSCPPPSERERGPGRSSCAPPSQSAARVDVSPIILPSKEGEGGGGGGKASLHAEGRVRTSADARVAWLVGRVAEGERPSTQAPSGVVG